MRTTVTIDDQLLKNAMEYTGIKEKAVLIRLGLEQLVQREASRRLALMGGTEPNATLPSRRRFK
jgi:Arc/MetJ family transcription regulator